MENFNRKNIKARLKRYLSSAMRILCIIIIATSFWLKVFNPATIVADNDTAITEPKTTQVATLQDNKTQTEATTTTPSL